MDFNETYEDTVSSVAFAARCGDAALLKELIQVHNKPTILYDNRGWRPLHEAASQGHQECVRLLVMADDAEVDTLTFSGLTPLYLAVVKHLEMDGESECVKILLEAGADPDMAHGVSWSLPVTKAVRNVALVKQLLDAGADPNREEFENGTPLHAAVEEGTLESVSLLLDRGADMTNMGEVSHTPFHALMLQHRRLTQPMDVLRLFIDRGINVDIRDMDGTTPLMLAVQSGWKYGVWKLLECGADVNLVNYHDVLALHYAIEFPKDDNNRMQQRKRKWQSDDDDDDDDDGDDDGGDGVDGNKVADYSFCEYEREEDTELLEKMLSLTSKGKFMPDTDDPQRLVKQLVSYSIYHLGIQWKRYKKLRTLLDAGIPPDRFLQETTGHIANLTIIPTNRKTEMPQVLVNIGVSYDTPLAFLLSSWPINTQLVHLVKYMVQKGSCVNALHPTCLPPLVALVKNKRATYKDGSPSLEILQYLIEKGADVMYKVSESDLLPVALHVSSLFNTAAFFRLLQSGVPVHTIYTHNTLRLLKDNYQYTWPRPFHLYDGFPWLIISWLHTVHLFVSHLPLDTCLLFNRSGDDTNLTAAWHKLDEKIGSPKSLQHLCILSVRNAVGEARGWPKLSTTLQQLATRLQLPQTISDLLQFKQTCLDSLNHIPAKLRHTRMTVRTPHEDEWEGDSSSEYGPMYALSDSDSEPRIYNNDDDDDEEEESSDDDDDDEEEEEEEDDDEYDDDDNGEMKIEEQPVDFFMGAVDMNVNTGGQESDDDDDDDDEGEEEEELDEEE
ncbi:hypothetical protein Pcinc_016031, partial [Petrolisthes cinctipes]